MSFVCSFPSCDKTFTLVSSIRARYGLPSHSLQRRNMKRHERLHTEEKEFKCMFDGCGKRFARRSDLKIHMMRHTGQRDFPCSAPACSKRFVSLSDLRVSSSCSSFVSPLFTRAACRSTSAATEPILHTSATRATSILARHPRSPCTCQQFTRGRLYLNSRLNSLPSMPSSSSSSPWPQ